MPRRANRRDFLKSSAAVSAVAWLGGNAGFAQEKSPNAKVRYACIGVGGRGSNDSAEASQHGEIAAICDVDEKIRAKAATRPGFENAEQFTDYREMFDKLGDKFDAVVISVPDHMHAPIAAQAMKMGKACFCQKPLTHSIWEARRLQDIAKETGVPTMMGNQGTALDELRKAAAVLKQGAIGKVKEVHVSTDRPVWPQGGPRPEPAEVPPFLNWDLWLGAAPERPYTQDYHTFKWRGWWDFGTGALGDMACHTFNMPFMGLGLANPKTIQAWGTGHNRDSYPQKSKIQFEFANPTGEGLMPVWWYDGGFAPEESLLNGRKFNLIGQKVKGSIIVGEDLILYSWGDYGDRFVLLDKNGEEVPTPTVEFEKSPGHFTEFHQSITGERKRATSNFEDYAGPLTETILLGNLSVYTAVEGEGQKIEWDAEKLEATNAPEVAKVVNKDYRNGYDEYLKG